MANLAYAEYFLIGLIFIWTGFVRSGLGFGGAALGLPLLLLIVDNPLVVLPIIAVHMLFFSSITTGSRLSNIDWPFLKRSLLIMAVPKMVGIFGLLNLPGDVLSIIVYALTLFYGIGYLLNLTLKSNNSALDTALLVFGGYISGTSLIAAPLLVAVFMRHVDKHQLRDTLFALWFILVSIKMVAFVSVGVDLQLIHHLWLLPLAAIGHFIGLKFHSRLIASEGNHFMRVIGGVLIVLSVIGLIKNF